MTRYIRLREWGQDVDVFKEPTDSYLTGCDSTLRKESYRLRTDSDGFIRTGVNIAGNSRPLLFLGDSIVENLYVHEDKRMCAALERALSDASKNIRVLNGGMTGATTLHLLNVFLNKGIPLAPMGVILMSGMVDINACLQSAAFWSDDRYITPITNPATIESRSNTSSLPEPDFAAREKILHVFSAAAATHGIPLWLATIPHRTNYEDPYLRKKYAVPDHFFNMVRYRQTVNAQTREFCRNKGIPVIDLEFRLQGRSDIFYDEFHLNEYGSRVVAEIILQYIPKMADYYQQLGSTLLRSGKLGEAIEAAQQSIRMDKSNAHYWHCYAEILAECGHLINAANAANQAFELAPQNAYYAFFTSRLLERTEALGWALEFARHATSLAPDSAQFSSHLKRLETLAAMEQHIFSDALPPTEASNPDR